MTRRSSLFAFLTILPLVSGTRAALAQGSTPAAAPPSSTAAAEATHQFRMGLEAKDRGDADEARQHFLNSYMLDPLPGTLRNLALAETAIPEYRVLALRHLRDWLRKASPADREKYARVIVELHKTTGHVAVTGSPAADVVVDDGNPAVATEDNGTLDVLPGHHTLRVRRKDATVAQQEVDVSAGADVTARFDLAPPPTPAPVARAAPPPLPSYAAAPVESPPPKDDHARADERLWLTVGLGVGAVALAGVSIGLFASAKSAHDDAQVAASQHPVCPASGCPDLDSDLSTERSRATAAYVLAGGAGLAAVGAALSWTLLGPKKEGGASALQVTPNLSPGHGGLLLRGTF